MTIEVLEGLKRKVTLEIEKQVIQDLVNKEIKKQAKKTKIAGFRPGKAPLQMVEQMYGMKAYEEALDAQINQSFFSFMTKEKLTLAGRPEFNLIQGNDESPKFIFSAEFEVMPEVVIGDLSTKEVEVFSCAVSDEQVNNTLELLRKQRATYTELADKPASDNDKVTIDFVGTVDGIEFEGGKAEGYSFLLGNKHMLPEFEAGIQGLKASESKDVEVNFPESYHAENLKGKKAVFHITVKKVEEPQLPEMNAEFIELLGVADGQLDSLRAEIKQNLDREINRRIRVKNRESAFNSLLDVSPMEVPYSLVHDEIHHMMDATKEDMKKQGQNMENVKLTHEMFVADARRMVTLRFLVSELIKTNKLTVTDDEIKAIVEDLASMYEDPAEYLEWYYKDKSRLEQAKSMALEEKVIKHILSLAKVVETAVSYEDLIQQAV